MQSETDKAAPFEAVLVAADVRRQIFAGLAPIVEGAVARLEPQARALVEAGTACGVQALIQVFPPILRILAVGEQRAIEFERVPGGVAPELVKAAETAIAGFLAAMRPEAAADLVGRADELRKAGKGGGFVLLIDFADDSVAALLNVDPSSLAESVVLGMIADRAPERAH